MGFPTTSLLSSRESGPGEFLRCKDPRNRRGPLRNETILAGYRGYQPSPAKDRGVGPNSPSEAQSLRRHTAAAIQSYDSPSRRWTGGSKVTTGSELVTALRRNMAPPNRRRTPRSGRKNTPSAWEIQGQHPTRGNVPQETEETLRTGRKGHKPGNGSKRQCGIPITIQHV